MEFFLADEQHTLAFSSQIAKVIQKSGVIYLDGDLGAGKTTFCRGFIRALGYCGNVKSPTYTLVESYDVSQAINGPSWVHHFDLYRLSDPEELDFIGIRDYFDEGVICLVEWPERGGLFLPDGDIRVHISVRDRGRLLKLTPLSEYGECMGRSIAGIIRE